MILPFFAKPLILF